MSTSIAWRLLVAAAIAIAGWAAAGQLTRVVRDSLEGMGLDPRLRRVVVRTVRPAVALVTIVAAFQYLDIDLSTVAAMAGAVTLAIGFTLQPALSNLATGALLLTLRPYQEGDWVECANGERGTVVEQGTFALILRRMDGVVVTIPNNIAFAAPIRNHTRHGKRRVEISFVLAHDADLQLARSVVLDAVRARPQTLRDPEPVLLVALEDRGVRLTTRAWIEPRAYGEDASDLSEHVIGALRLAGLPMAPFGWTPGGTT